MDYEELESKVWYLEHKNAELRKLVEYMYRCYVMGHDWGPYGAPEKQWVEDRMRELGIRDDQNG